MLERIISLIRRLTPSVEPIIIRVIERFLPDWSDPEAVRQFALRYLGYLENWASSTANKVDDAVVAALRLLAEDKELFNGLYQLIKQLLTEEEQGSAAYSKALRGDARLQRVADDAKLDPAVLIMLVQLIIEVIRIWRGRNASDVTEKLN